METLLKYYSEYLCELIENESIKLDWDIKNRIEIYVESSCVIKSRYNSTFNKRDFVHLFDKVISKIEGEVYIEPEYGWVEFPVGEFLSQFDILVMARDINTDEFIQILGSTLFDLEDIDIDGFEDENHPLIKLSYIRGDILNGNITSIGELEEKLVMWKLSN